MKKIEKDEEVNVEMEIHEDPILCTIDFKGFY